MEIEPDNLWGDPISRYTRAQAIAAGALVDLTTATDDKGQSIRQQAGFKIPVALTRTAGAKTIAVGVRWKPDGEGEVHQNIQKLLLKPPGAQTMAVPPLRYCLPNAPV